MTLTLMTYTGPKQTGSILGLFHAFHMHAYNWIPKKSDFASHCNSKKIYSQQFSKYPPLQPIDMNDEVLRMENAELVLKMLMNEKHERTEKEDKKQMKAQAERVDKAEKELHTVPFEL